MTARLKPLGRQSEGHKDAKIAEVLACVGRLPSPACDLVANLQDLVDLFFALPSPAGRQSGPHRMLEHELPWITRLQSDHPLGLPRQIVERGLLRKQPIAQSIGIKQIILRRHGRRRRRRGPVIIVIIADDRNPRHMFRARPRLRPDPPKPLARINQSERGRPLHPFSRADETR